MERRGHVTRSLHWWHEGMKRRTDREVGGLRKKFRRFASEAKEDLEFLYSKDANPFALIHIIDTYLWWWGGYAIEAAKEDDQALRTISSHVYWTRCLKAVGRLEILLSKLRTYDWVRIAALVPPDKEDTPLMRISRHAVAADSAVRQLAHTVRELGLNEPGREFKRVTNRELPSLCSSPKRGKRLGGRAKEADWGKCATVLHAYLTLMTGKPHWVSIVRLLRSADVPGFKEEIPREGKCRAGEDKYVLMICRREYTDVVRHRVNRLREDPVIRVHADESARGYNMWFGRDGMLDSPD